MKPFKYSKSVGACLISALLLFTGGTVLEARDDIFRKPHDAPLKNIEETPWQEQEQEIDAPDYPEDENLLEFHVDQPGSQFRYFIDTKSISVGEDDGLVRYVLVIRSRRGGENVMYEAMHCTERQYKTYAYGTGKREFRPLSKPRWRSIGDTRNVRYRKDLWEFYLCDFETRKTRSSQEIIDSIRYPRENRSDTGF